MYETKAIEAVLSSCNSLPGHAPDNVLHLLDRLGGEAEMTPPTYTPHTFKIMGLTITKRPKQIAERPIPIITEEDAKKIIEETKNAENGLGNQAYRTMYA
jgi:hypothetical protein